jgi:hypothetical protein
MAPVGLQHLTALCSLHLVLDLGTVSSSWRDLDAAAAQLQTCEAAAAEGIQHLTHLTHLTLGGVYATEAVLCQVSGLQRLRELQVLRPECDVTLDAYGGRGPLRLLPDGLSKVSVDGSCWDACRR